LALFRRKESPSRNVILEVDDNSIVMFFKKRLKDSSLIQMLTMKNPRMSEQMFSIANRYALAEEATPDNREQKKESGHLDQPSSSKGKTKRENRTAPSMQ
jgi:antitoxin component of MazEF toxin-antitoxin module